MAYYPWPHRHSPEYVHPHERLDSRSRQGLAAVGLSLLVLVITAVVQSAILMLSGSVALLADLTHNLGDALTAVPVGLAFLLQSARAERSSSFAVVLAILVSASFAGAAAVDKLLDPEAPDHLLALAGSGAIGVIGNAIAAGIRAEAGKKLHSHALVADADHARADALVSFGVVASAVLVGIGFPIADPLIAVAITAAILHIAWHAWGAVTQSTS
jgi:cation diffusion facilitator family transporter